MLKVIAYTPGLNAPSARFRIRQYVSTLKNNYNIELVERYSLSGTYPPYNKYLRPFWASFNLSEHFISSFFSFNFDAVIFQREMFSSHFTFENITKKPRIFDVDDSIWMQNKNKFSDKIASHSDLIICGNSFIAEYYEKINRNICVIPTGVDCKAFYPIESANNSKKIICWSGTESNLKYLYGIESALNHILNNKIVLRVISNRYPKFKILKPYQFEFFYWSAETEVKLLQDIDVGIMPLTDDEWTRGKCSFKMLTYMACAKPVVVSPVGMNIEIMKDGEAGFFASKNSEWSNNILELINNPNLSKQLGEKARDIVLSRYSTEIVANRIAKELFNIT